MLQKSIMSRICNNEYKIDLRLFGQIMEFSSMLGSLCTEMHHPTLTLKGDTLRIFCNCQKVTTQRPCLRNLMFIKKTFNCILVQIYILFVLPCISCSSCIMYFLYQHVTTTRQGFVKPEDFLSPSVPVCDFSYTCNCGLFLKLLETIPVCNFPT